MTNYNERLYEILYRLYNNAYIESNKPVLLNENVVHITNAKQAITSLIKELVAEAKPEIKAHPLGPVTLADCQRGLDHYEANILKALEEV